MNKNKTTLSYLQFAFSVAIIISTPVSLAAGVGSLVSLSQSKYATDIINSLTQTRFAEAGTYGNIPPVAVGDSYIVDSNTPTTLDVLANDYETEGEDFDIYSVYNANHGTVSIINNNTQLLYTPDPGYYGTDSFDYRIKDSYWDYDSATVNIIVNSLPTAGDDFYETNTFQTFGLRPQAINSIDIDIAANDTDLDGIIDPTSVTILTLPAKGTVLVNPLTGIITYTFTSPLAIGDNFDTFRYTIKDNRGGLSNTATATVKFNYTPPAPTPPATPAVSPMQTTSSPSPLNQAGEQAKITASFSLVRTGGFSPMALYSQVLLVILSLVSTVIMFQDKSNTSRSRVRRN